MNVYIHAGLDERIPLALGQPEIIYALADAMAELLPIKNWNGLKLAYSILSERRPRLAALPRPDLENHMSCLAALDGRKAADHRSQIPSNLVAAHPHRADHIDRQRCFKRAPGKSSIVAFYPTNN